MMCPICETALRQQDPAWLYRCPGCRFEASSLDCAPARITSEDDQLDETAREAALHTLRRGNFRTLLDTAFRETELAGMTILDVGCGHGWFLDEAKARGLVTFGIEPDAKVARRSTTQGDHSIRDGFFPEALAETERFDIIIFNDVFEHLPDVRAALRAVDRHLAPGGHLILNMPSRDGVFYRLACTFAALSLRRPLERMWQKDMPSPHLSYFTRDDAQRLCARHGFAEACRFSLPSLPFAHLWQRLRLSKSNPVVVDMAIWVGCALLIPFLRLLPPDITVQRFRRA